MRANQECRATYARLPSVLAGGHRHIAYYGIGEKRSNQRNYPRVAARDGPRATPNRAPDAPSIEPGKTREIGILSSNNAS